MENTSEVEEYVQEEYVPERETRPKVKVKVNPVAIGLEKVHLGEEIGSGSFGNVHEATINGVKRAVKVFKNDQTGRSHYKKEKKALEKFHGDTNDIVTFYNFVEEEGNSRMLILEYFPKKLSDAIKVLTWKSTLQILRQVANALNAIHVGGFVYGDLKPDNILLRSGDTSAALCDLGSLLEIGRDAVNAIYTDTYAAPEMKGRIAGSRRITAKADSYSFGVVMLQLLFKEEDGAVVVTKARSDPSGDKIHEHLVSAGCERKDAMELALLCVKDRAVDRLSMGDILKRLDEMSKKLRPRKR